MSQPSEPLRRIDPTKPAFQADILWDLGMRFNIFWSAQVFVIREVAQRPNRRRRYKNSETLWFT